MKTFFARAGLLRSALIVIVSVLTGVAACPSAMAQTNAWTNSMSGNWQDAEWSLGILPGSNQDIQLTNAGWKAVGIAPATAVEFSETLNVNSITIASPADSSNTLLLNYSGTQTPLVIGGSNNLGSLAIDPGSAVVMFASGLDVRNAIATDGSRQGAFLIEGAFTEAEGSQVSAGFMDLRGVYNLTNSLLSVGTENLAGTFNQHGGTNSAKLWSYQNYNLFDGTVAGTLRLMGGQFIQWGGEVSAGLDFVNGQFQLAGGNFSPGTLSFPDSGGFSGTPFGVMFLQSGGTNTADAVSIGFTVNTTGSYTLSGGALNVSNLSVGPTEFRLGVIGNNFNQSGGCNTSGAIRIQGGSFTDGGGVTIALSDYNLSAGTLVTPSMNLQMGAVQQSGGTNQVGTLSLSSGSSYSLSNGELIAQDVQVNGSFHHTGGSVSIADTLTLGGATWDEQTGGEQLGRLQVTGSNSLVLPPSISCRLQFAGSSSLTWSNSAMLAIANWSGSLYGGGRHQVIFGNSAAGLSGQQVGDIKFHHPAGLLAGDYPARILADGEVVPDSGSPLPLIISDLSRTNGAMQLTIGGDIGSHYGIEISSDLQHWTQWTNQWNSSGTIVVSDGNASNAPVRFYRTVRLQ